MLPNVESDFEHGAEVARRDGEVDVLGGFPSANVVEHRKLLI